MAEYYDGTKLLSLSDLDGNKPEIYICTTNRSGGKTTYFGRLCVNRFFDRGEKFGLIYRFNYELDNVADKFFKDIGELFFPDYYMFSERKASGIFHELYLCKKNEDKASAVSCGYALTLNSADQIKKYSHFFSDISRMIFDEFQSETGHYCSREIEKFISVHTSIARGQGKQVRYVPVYMISNPVSLINPYYVELGIAARLKKDTKFLRGNGFVMEQGFIESASSAQKDSGFNTAFAGNNYIAYSAENVYLNDSEAFIEKMSGRSRYILTLKFKGREYAIREFGEQGILYCDDRPDGSYKGKLSVTTEDHNINYVMLKRNDILILNLKWYYEHGVFRFKNMMCKEALMTAVSYL